MRNVTKAIFLNTLVCPSLAWSMRNKDGNHEREATLGELFRIEEGKEVGRRARKLFDNGILIDEKDSTIASEKTKMLMNDPNVSTIFEATFSVGNLVTKVDVLKRENKNWHLIEVKSSVNDHVEFIDDMAYTTMVMRLCGINPGKISILIISRDFRLGMSDNEMFVGLEHTQEVLDRSSEFMDVWKRVEEVTRNAEKPQPELTFDCRKCSFLRKCVGEGIENHIFDIPRISRIKFDELAESNITSIEDIPDSFPLTENQQRVRRSVLTKTPFVGPQLKSSLGDIIWPAHYLDFETMKTAIPLYPDIAPHTQLPTQYSIHACSGIGIVVEHKEYLADPKKNCTREIAENLIRDLEGNGSIIVYGNFEKIVIKKLSKDFPDLSDELESLLVRLKDLEKIIRDNFYHHGFHGKTSIKKTLPVLVPEMTYDNLQIMDGDSAMAVFAFMALGEYKDGEIGSVRINLLEYCKQDTLAMVELHKKLASLQ